MNPYQHIYRNKVYDNFNFNRKLQTIPKMFPLWLHWANKERERAGIMKCNNEIIEEIKYISIQCDFWAVSQQKANINPVLNIVISSSIWSTSRRKKVCVFKETIIDETILDDDKSAISLWKCNNGFLLPLTWNLSSSLLYFILFIVKKKWYTVWCVLYLKEKCYKDCERSGD